MKTADVLAVEQIGFRESFDFAGGVWSTWWTPDDFGQMIENLSFSRSFAGMAGADKETWEFAE